MTGLMFKQPEDPVEYMLECLESVRQKPGNKSANKHANHGSAVKWNTFLTLSADTEAVATTAAAINAGSAHLGQKQK